MNEDALMTLEEAAAALRLSTATLRWYRAKGIGPLSFKIGRRVVYRESSVDAWVRSQELHAVGGLDA